MRTSPLLFAAFLLSAPVLGQEPTASDSTGLPGDHFNLAGALDLFKNSVDLEAFETALNKEDNHVNNLDLDGNGEIDYVRVVTHKEGDALAIVMQVAVSKEESQDVAVIELEKTGNEQAAVQIRGDEELYAENTIMEPTEQKEGMKDGKGPMGADLRVTYVSVNVWFWPCVTWCYSPRFYVWVSPWYWGYYPPWWRPWRPHPWRTWWGWGYHHHHWYHHVHSCNVVRAHAIYAPRRAYSPIVRKRYQPARDHFKATRPAQQRPAVEPRPNKLGKPGAPPSKERTKPNTRPAPKPERQKPVRPAPKPNRQPPPAPKPGRKH